jgi:hypothetical protein
VAMGSYMSSTRHEGKYIRVEVEFQHAEISQGSRCDASPGDMILQGWTGEINYRDAESMEDVDQLDGYPGTPVSNTSQWGGRMGANRDQGKSSFQPVFVRIHDR